MKVVKRPTREQREAFRREVFHAYGSECAFCHIVERDLLDAAHLLPWRERGIDKAYNALVLCKLHHCALDLGFVRVQPSTGALQAKLGGPTLEQLNVDRADIGHLRQQPHRKALEYLWNLPAPSKSTF